MASTVYEREICLAERDTSLTWKRMRERECLNSQLGTIAATHPHLLPQITLLYIRYSVKPEIKSVPHSHHSILRSTLPRASRDSASHVFLNYWFGLILEVRKISTIKISKTKGKA